MRGKFLIASWLGLVLAAASLGVAGGSPILSSGFAPGESIKFKRISLEAGLSQSSVYAILQDSQGFLWFGTEDGLNRYDGNSFRIWKSDPDDPNSLSDRWIFALAQDRSGNIWIGTRAGGLDRYDPQTGRITRYMNDPQDPGSLGSNSIRCLYVDRSDVLWIGTADGLDRFDAERKAFTHYRNDPSNPASLADNSVRTIHQDPLGVLWVGTAEGLSRFDPSSNTFTSFRHDPQDPGSLAGNLILAIGQDRQGKLWIGTLDGLDRMDPAAQTFEHVASGDHKAPGLRNPVAQAMAQDDTGLLWLGTPDGLSWFDPAQDQFTTLRPEPGDPSSISSATILSVYPDRTGGLWVGTYGGGVNHLDRGRMKFAHYQNRADDPTSLTDGLVFQLTEDQAGYIWAAIYGGGLDRFDRATGQFTHYRHNAADPNSLGSDHVYAVHADRQDTLWIGTDAGLDALNLKTGSWTHYPVKSGKGDGIIGAPVYTLLQDQSGAIWIGTRAGLDRFDPVTGEFAHFRADPNDPRSLSHNSVASLYETPAGELWVGTNAGGLNRFDSATGQFQRFLHDPTNPKSLSAGTTLAIHQDRTGTLWVAVGGGLNRFDRKTETFVRYTEKNGLPNDVVYAIVEDEQGYLWLSTNNGVSRFDPRTDRFVNYDEDDGLQSREFNMNSYLKTRSGEILLGGVRGLNLFNPDRIRANDQVPSLALTGLTQEGKPVPADRTVETLQEITLRWPRNYFEFEFAALSYTEPDKNQYAYRLEGFDQDWTAASTRHFGRYTNLPGGNYTLRLKGSNNDGAWNDTGLALRVTVVPPIWETWWLRGGLVVVLGLTVYGSYRWRMRGIRQRSAELERQVQERTAEIERLFEQSKELAIVEERNRLARDLHDSAKQKAFAALAQLGAARGIIKHDLTTAGTRLAEAEDLVYEVIQELTFLIQEMYPMALKEKGLIRVLREYLYEWESRADIGVALEVKEERRLPLQIEQALYRITQESLANVARHSRASRVEIHLTYAPDLVELDIHDNGSGFDLAQKPTGVGLRSMQERAAMIEGQLDIVSSAGRGTRIHLRAPVNSRFPASNENGNHGGHSVASNHRTDRG